jgi:hypothetical protein
MKRLFIAVALITVLASISGVLWTSSGVSIKNKPRLNTKGVPENGLHLLDVSAPEFEKELHLFLVKNNHLRLNTVEQLKPFSVFLKNNNKKDVVVYKILWEIVKSDGTTIQHQTSYADPETLMGIEISPIRT